MTDLTAASRSQTSMQRADRVPGDGRLLVVAPAFIYPLFLMKALCFALFACAFNLLIGYVGLLSFGHALYFGWASYLTALFREGLGLPAGACDPHRRATAALFGLIAGSLAIRRQGIYFAMITLALAQMMFFFAVQAKFTGGEDGIQAVPRGTAVRSGQSDRPDQHVHHGGRDLPRRLPADLSRHQFAVRRGAQGDPRERGARDLARLQDRPLQAGRLRAVGGARRAGRRAPRRSCCRSLRSPTSTGRCRARWC